MVSKKDTIKAGTHSFSKEFRLKIFSPKIVRAYIIAYKSGEALTGGGLFPNNEKK